jgi:hypothetical protein
MNMLTENEKNLVFLKEKIKDLESALFFNHSTAVLKLPVCVVRILDVDELGQLWYSVNRPSQCLEHFEHEFPGELQFYKKGRQHRINIQGKAIIVDDPEVLNTLPEHIAEKYDPKTMVLLRMKMSHVNYFEPAEFKKTNLFANVRNAIYKWIYNDQPQYQPYLTDTAF